eukprot:scaffold34558_cov52-Phaeocystis_antarctica.AAC.2
MCGSQSRSSNTRADLISRAAPRSPARAIASRGEGRSARPRATDQQLVGVGQGVSKAHPEHAGHGRDLGRVEAQRLVEHRRALPSRKEGMRCGARCGARACGAEKGRKRHSEGRPGSRLGARARAERTKNMYCMVVTLDVSNVSGWLNAKVSCRESKGGHPMRGEVWAGRREGYGAALAQAACTGRAGLKAGNREHARSAPGTCEAQRLVEHRRVLPSRKGGIRCGARRGPGGERVWGGGGASDMHGEGPTEGCGGQGTRGAHVKHVAHVCDAGRVEAQRLVEGQRPLPSRKEGIRCGARCAGPERRRREGVGRGRRKRHAHGEGPTGGWGLGHA